MAQKGGKVDASGLPISSVRIVTDSDADSGLGTAIDPIRIDPTGTTVQPVAFASAQHVIVDSGGGSGGANAAAGPTGSAVPADADYTGFNSGGNLVGVSSANPLPVSPPANASTNIAQVAGTTADTNSGAKSAGTLRVVLATDQPALTNKILVTPDSVALPANQSVNASQWGGTTVTAATNDAPVGTETAPVTRPIQRKKTTVETTATLGSGAVFTGNWHDSELDGTLFVQAMAFATTIGSAASGFILQESDDNTNANLTRTTTSTTATVATLTRIMGLIKSRYWRVQYTNGAGTQGAFELTSCAMAFVPAVVNNSELGGGTIPTPPVTPIVFAGSNGSIGDNSTSSNYTSLANSVGNTNPLVAFTPVYGGSFSGAASAGLQGWTRPRTPTIFKQVSTASTGSTAVWTPGTGNKFRLLGFRIQVTALATKATSAADLTIKLLDSATDMGVGTIVTIQTTANTTLGGIYDSGWVPLGAFGILSAAANNVLNINLSLALATGLVNVAVCGTEE